MRPAGLCSTSISFVRDLIAFAGLAAIIIIVPGPDMALVLRNGVTAGRRAALETAVGVIVGLLVWALAAAFGIAAILEASSSAFTVLKIAGAAYLIFLGVTALRDAWRGGALHAAPGDAPADAAGRVSSPFRQGLLSNLLNPKSAIVFTTLIPQFLAPGDAAVARTVFLATVFISMAFVWFIFYALLVAQVGAVLRRPLVRRTLNAIVGTALTAFGVRLAVERR